ncbi:hypothetical protein R1sor_003882 [Riccia sorocarpa]|uniref:ethanolamine kinase n=1 Tax=Riccia sorocarpa TaxID=122646 RepID=A0ABD3H2Y3_9MARC
METPSCNMYVDPAEEEETLKKGVRHVCRSVVKEWQGVEETLMEVSHITGGITNLLLKVEVKSPGISPESVTVRIFGPHTETVIDRDREKQALRHLSESGFGAGLIGLFDNGMVQTFIVARTLTPPELSQPATAARIAKELRRLHETEAPFPKEPQLWADISRFMEKASTLSFEDPKKNEIYQSIPFSELQEEIDELKRSSKSLEAPIVFAHNDLLSGNVMYNEEEDKMYFIDFEYSTYNYRGYDIANHFNEYAGFECDYNLYPSKDAQYHFFRHYLSSLNSEKVSEAELEKLYIETNVYALGSHLYWGIWAIVQARYSSIDFDYLDYFFLRYGEYKRRKNEFLSLIPSQQIDK